MKHMIVISSRQNPTLKHVTKLLTSTKYRREQGLAVAEGIHLAQCLEHSNLGLELIVIADSAMHNPEVVAAVEAANQKNVPTVTATDSVFSAISSLGVGSGILSVFHLPELGIANIITSDAVLLEDIQDPGNIGTILRSVAAAGVQQVFLSGACASPWSPKALRAGMGAQFCIDISVTNELSKLLRASSVPVLATSLQATESLYTQDLRSPHAWVFGNEGQGISPELLSLVTTQVIIPQASTIESLNVAMSVAICLFEQRRQRLG